MKLKDKKGNILNVVSKSTYASLIKIGYMPVKKENTSKEQKK